MSNSTVSIKRCNSCHKDVTDQQRMKDSSGRYWCVTCGAAHQKKSALMAAENRRQSKSNNAMGARSSWVIKLLVVMGLLAVGAAWRFSIVQ